ncbi:hypothetical protein [Paracidovorax konjaci]|uniref:Uncharacterized protein n=1 Tax=Paracidovorax konjaci TaxID=32040 RepID=A0A1I1YI53_9BURK|nr:hypothetical protein [Paracidovorax konjaci]SFE19216.1 hypothetical protein SAMN04489710_11826 [Paracidovorax konjaci]
MAKNAAIGMNKDWQAESDMKTLTEAEEIRRDPARYKAALAKAKEKMAALQQMQAAAKK